MSTHPHILREAAQNPGLSCHEVVERLPWLRNGSIEGQEQEGILDHLQGCESCLAEWEELLCDWQVMSQHIPSLDLAEYAQGLPASGVNRERLEAHLAVCPSCSQELSWAMADQVIDFEAARDAVGQPDTPTRNHRPSRVLHFSRKVFSPPRLGLAASVAALLAIAILTLLPSFRAQDPGRIGPTIADVSQGTSVQAAHAKVEHIPAEFVQADGVLFADGFEQQHLGRWRASQSITEPN